ncbi:hypothetical protein M9H77_04322 [Catharanthus roseus]|uniref:Uncharacterized protein n=1 Tax=Catharanthus roseus TaxID=4058 RepID=A0ACC0CDY2_CATRO|nr:hypothetical protein M9H77_04322 [Catharanthus roseus]
MGLDSNAHVYSSLYIENVQSEQALKFFKGLNDSFESVRSNVLMIVPLPDMNAVCNMAINHERQQGCGANQVMSQVMSTQEDSAHGVSLAYATQHEVPASFVNAVGFQTQGGPAFAGSVMTQARNVLGSHSMNQITQNPIAGFTNDQYEKLMYLINNTQINTGNENGTVKPLVNQIHVGHAARDKVNAICAQSKLETSISSWKCERSVYQNTFKTLDFRFRGN